MIHETYECDRCHVKQPKEQAKAVGWACTWTSEPITVPTPNRQKSETMAPLLCPKCTDFLAAHLRQIVTEAKYDQVLAALLKATPNADEGVKR